MRAVLFILLGLLLVPPVEATRGGENVPKVLTYSSGINLLSEQTQDSLSWYDVLVCMDRPETIASLRERNPDQRYLWHILPQYVRPLEDENPWWLPDTLWSARRLMIYYAAQNDWYLKDTGGEPIFDGSRFLLNWTEHCPEGTFGSSKGLRAAEWVASVALPTAALSERYWDPWSWDSRTAYNGFMFEILVDCLGSYNWSVYAEADPDGDGEAEGVYSECSGGGADDPLSVLFRAENEIFFDQLQNVFPEDFIFVINENNRFVGPWWRTKLSGMKLENWMRPHNPDWHNWWDWFYGFTPPWDPDDNWGVGYAWAESEFDNPSPDSLKGWDLSFIEVWSEAEWDEEENFRQMRWGLGTSILGDGYFCYTRDQILPLWQPEFDYDFGEPLGDFDRESFRGDGPDFSRMDTVYVRLFEHGMVEVNPNDTATDKIPARDSRFTFWLPVDDLWGTAYDNDAIEAGWTAPVGEVNQADSYDLRYAETPLSPENWEAATSYEENPIVVPPGSPVVLRINDLTPGETYHLAVRTRTGGRLEPFLSNRVSVTIPLEEDATPPGMIDDLRAATIDTTWVDLLWSATGDDGEIGHATGYLLRTLTGDSILAEQDWDRADPATGLPQPGVPGATEEYRLAALAPGTLYGIAVRALDEIGNLSPLPPPFTVTTFAPPPPDTLPPATIDDLDGNPGEIGRIQLRWTAPGDDLWEGQASAYEIRLLAERVIATEQDWQEASAAPGDPPIPGQPMTPEELEIFPLVPGRDYGVSVRALDEGGLRGGLSNPLLLRAGGDMGTEQDTIPPAPIDDLQSPAADTVSILLAWTAPADSGETGMADRYHLRIAPDGTEESQVWELGSELDELPPPSDPGRIDSYRVRGLEPGMRYGFVVRSEDEAGNLSNDSNIVWASTMLPPPSGSAPDPVNDLRVVAIGPDSARVAWTAPDADGKPATAYLARIRVDAAIETETDWDEAAVPDTTGLGRPGTPGSPAAWTLQGLDPTTTYFLAIRAVDDAGRIADLSNPLAWTTEDLPLLPPNTIDDLRTVGSGETWCDLLWSRPPDEPDREEPERYRLAYREGTGAIATEEDWEAATEVSDGLPPPGPPGSDAAYRLEGLLPSSDYAIAVRSEDQWGRLDLLTRSIVVRTDDPIDPPPAPITDLVVAAHGVDWVELRWTAVGEDASEGRAARYAARILEDDSFLGPEDWERADPIADQDLPTPGESGTLETLNLGSLVAGTTYAFAVRAVDGAGQLSPWAGGVAVTLPAETIPPLQVEDLRVLVLNPTSAMLRWSHPRDPDDADGPTGFVVGLDTQPIEEATWESVTKHPSPPPPAAADHTVEVEWPDLEETTSYWVRVRALGHNGTASVLSEPATFTTRSSDHDPPQPPSNLRVTEAGAIDQIRLEWDPSPAHDLLGYYLYGDDAIPGWRQVPIDLIPGSRTHLTLEPCCPSLAMSAVDSAGNEGEKSEPVILFAETLRLRGPFPHPIDRDARIEVEIPLRSVGQPIDLTIYDIQGRFVRNLHEGLVGPSGLLQMEWDRTDADGRHVVPGVYFLRLRIGSREMTKRLFLLR